MLLYILFWMFNGLYYTLSYYFWDEPINPRPSANCCFFAYFSVSQKRNIKRSPNGMKPSGELFLEQTWSRWLGVDVKKHTRRPGRGARLPPGRALHPRGPLVAPPTYFFLLYISTYPENIQEHNENLIPPSQPSVSGGGIDHGGPLHQH